ncbi:MAG: hypothetical protein NUW08_04185 [Candidatus Uhrbacteria bacterium]|nr:hypothetical protein [Candidatus Uhrbacteria bacterium]
MKQMKLTLEQKVDLLVEKTSQIDLLVEKTSQIDLLVEKTNQIDHLVEKTGQIDGLVQKVDRILEKVTEHDRLFVSIDQRFDGIDQRLGSVEATLDVVAVEVVNLRGDMDEVKVRVESLEHRFDDGFTKLDAYVAEMNRQNLEILANRSGIFRHEERIEVLERSA